MAPHPPNELRNYVGHLVTEGKITAQDFVRPGVLSLRSAYRHAAAYKALKHIPKPKKSSGRPSKLTEEHRRYIIALVRHRPTIYLDEIAHLLLRYFAVQVTGKTVGQYLHAAGFTNKVVSRKSIQADAERRRIHRLTFAQLHPDQLVFADESSTNRRTNARQRGWSQRGTPAIQLGVLLKGQRHSLLPAIATDGIFSPWIVSGSVNAERFQYWLEHHCLPKMRPWPEPKSVLVLDNCNIHKNARVRRLVEERGCHLLFIPPYSPDLNPIEFAFAAIKRRLKREPATHEFDVVKACYDAVSPEHGRAYFRAAGYGRHE